MLQRAPKQRATIGVVRLRGPQQSAARCAGARERGYRDMAQREARYAHRWQLAIA
jgi:hypothetical protein